MKATLSEPEPAMLDVGLPLQLATADLGSIEGCRQRGADADLRGLSSGERLQIP